MPNKTIYVADSDLPVFDRAQELAGENLSATIAQALRHFIETEEARRQGFGEITLKVGKQMQYTRKQFLGRELARHRDYDPAAGRVLTQVVFQTAKGRFVLYTGSAPDWSAWSAYWANWGKEWSKNWTRDWTRDWARGWDWNVDVNVDMSPGADRDTRAQARERARAEARARREEMRERARQARERARAEAHTERGDREPVDWPDWIEGGDYDMEVYETLDELKPHISEAFYAAVVRAMRGEDIEFLDI
ncbi:MAG TPA: EXLDI protein [Ktedonobacterales bacterium]